MLWNVTQWPSAEIDCRSLEPSPSFPAASMLARVVCCACTRCPETAIAKAILANSRAFICELLQTNRSGLAPRPVPLLLRRATARDLRGAVFRGDSHPLRGPWMNAAEAESSRGGDRKHPFDAVAPSVVKREGRDTCRIRTDS